jgi:hypothetical protein
MTSPYGTGPWGTGGWGSSAAPSPPPPGVTFPVYAITTNDVLVIVPASLLARSSVLAGDSTNPSTWKIRRLDTNELVPIAFVTVIGTTPAAPPPVILVPVLVMGPPVLVPTYPTTVTIHTQLELPDQLIQLELTAPTLLDASGVPYDIGAPTFAGVTQFARSTPEIIASTKTQGPRDLTNHPVPASPSGTLIVKGGDYTTETGTALLRKLVLRRLVARPGDFYHLPGYGVGLRIKQPLPAGNLIGLQTEIKQQLQLEPDVASVKVALTQSTNLLFVKALVLTKKTGQQLEIGLPISIGGSP